LPTHLPEPPDLVNGQLAGSRSFHISSPNLKLAGWAMTERTPFGPDVYVVLTGAGKRYAIKATRVARPDVATHFAEPRLEMAGFDAEGTLGELPAGTYRAGIAQPNAANLPALYCEFPNMIAIER
jgi:hypothetical protein